MLKGLLPTFAAMVMATLVACGGGGESVPSPTHVATTTPTPPAATATPTPTPTPTLLPTASPAPGSEGNPFSFVDLQKEWEGRGIAVTLGDPSAGFSGLGATALDARLIQDSDSMDLSILVYRDHEAASEDWELVPGEAPTAKAGLSLPAHTSTWWNENVVIVVRSRSGNIATAALEGFLALSP